MNISQLFVCLLLVLVFPSAHSQIPSAAERPALEEKMLTLNGDRKRSLQFVLGRSYAHTSHELLRAGNIAESSAELERAYELLGALRRDPGGSAPPHLMLELTKLFGFVARRQGYLEEAAEAYEEVVLHDLHLARHSKMFECADPRAVNYNPELTKRGERGRGDDCIMPSRLRYYGQTSLILERELGRNARLERAFAELTSISGVGWTSPYQIPVNFVEGLAPARALWTDDDARAGFRVVALLEANAAAVLADLEALLDSAPGSFAHNPDTDEHQLIETGSWTQVQLVADGMQRAAFDETEPGCARAPRTCALFRAHWDELQADIGARQGRDVPGAISFARLDPGTRLVAHTGPTNERLTLHLGLHTPRGPRMRVAGEWVGWESGKVLLFDDSFEHMVQYDELPDEQMPRYILHMNVWHPAAGRAAANERGGRKRKRWRDEL